MSSLLEPVDRAARALLARILAGKAGIPNHVLPLAELMEVATAEELARLGSIYFDTFADYNTWADAWSLFEQTRGGGS